MALTRVRAVGPAERRRTVWLEDACGAPRDAVKSAARACLAHLTGIPADQWDVLLIEEFHTPDDNTREDADG